MGAAEAKIEEMRGCTDSIFPQGTTEVAKSMTTGLLTPSVPGKATACQQRYRCHLEKNATQMAAISRHLTIGLVPSMRCLPHSGATTAEEVVMEKPIWSRSTA